MTMYRTVDGRVRVLSTRVRGDWHRLRNRRGGLSTWWHAYNIEENHWITRDHSTLRSIKKKLAELGYCSPTSCRLLRESEK